MHKFLRNSLKFEQSIKAKITHKSNKKRNLKLPKIVLIKQKFNSLNMKCERGEKNGNVRIGNRGRRGKI